VRLRLIFLLNLLLLAACKNPPPSTIEAYFPFKFTGSVDPRAIYTVSDQIIGEHVFAFHARQSINGGFQPVVSRLDFFPERGRIDIAPLHAIATSDGTPFPLRNICMGVTESLSGTQHAPYAALVQGVDCLEREGKISIRLSAIPANMRFLFTLPDFSIYNPATVPLTPGNLAPTTGPYSIVSMNQEVVELKRNPHYPAALVANTVPAVRLHSYPAIGTGGLIDVLSVESHHMIYLYGYAVSGADLEKLKAKKYVVEAYPEEWLVYVGFGRKVPLAIRETIAAVVDDDRERWVADTAFGSPAYSISPSDRSFALSRQEYSDSSGRRDASRRTAAAARLVTHRSWYALPLFRKICDALQARFTGMELRLVDNFSEIFSGDGDVFVSPLGISHSDPLSHLSYLSNALPGFDEAVAGGEVAKASVLADPGQFDSVVKGFERRVRQRRALVPVGHFPGIVAHAPRFERDESLSYSWGIQTWSYRIR
jgi:hypothetical protein